MPFPFLSKQEPTLHSVWVTVQLQSTPQFLPAHQPAPLICLQGAWARPVIQSSTNWTISVLYFLFSSYKYNFPGDGVEAERCTRQYGEIGSVCNSTRHAWPGCKSLPRDRKALVFEAIPKNLREQNGALGAEVKQQAFLGKGGASIQHLSWVKRGSSL